MRQTIALFFCFVRGICGLLIRRMVPGSSARVAGELAAGWMGVAFFRSQLPFEPV